MAAVTVAFFFSLAHARQITISGPLIERDVPFPLRLGTCEADAYLLLLWHISYYGI